MLEEVVSRFQKTCEVNRDKENTSHGKREVAPRLACSCPVLPLERWRSIWDAVLSSMETMGRYIEIKELLGFMGEDNVRKLLLGFKSQVIDDEFGFAASMMKGHRLTMDESVALYSYSYNCGQDRTISRAMLDVIIKWCTKGENPAIEGACYLLHLM